MIDMKTSEELLVMVNDFLANLPYNRKPLSLYEPVKYVLSLGGKRIRPVLMLLGYNLFKNSIRNFFLIFCKFQFRKKVISLPDCHTNDFIN